MDEPIAEAPADSGNSSLERHAAAFCSTAMPGLFRGVVHQADVWKPDPFDVESIHEPARSAFRRMVASANNQTADQAGKMLLLLGEAGSGKTHLMRAFRTWTHSGRRGYFAYMQMSSNITDYSQYILRNVIESLDKPYSDELGASTGLSLLSRRVAEGAGAVGVDRFEQLRSDEFDPECLARLVDALADSVVLDERFNSVDIDLVRALLYLQTGDPRIKLRVLKYLRCEDLSERDREMLGGMVPRIYQDAAMTLLRKLGELCSAIDSAPLVVCVDQIENVYKEDHGGERFRRALVALCDYSGYVQASVVVISCLEDYFEAIRPHITRPLLDRIARDPEPLRLKGAREPEEIESLVLVRLERLYHEQGLEVPRPRTYPLPAAILADHAGKQTREVLLGCGTYRDRCIAAGRVIEHPSVSVASAPGEPESESTDLDLEWNDYKNAFEGSLPETEDELANVLALALELVSVELPSRPTIQARAKNRFIEVELSASAGLKSEIMIAVCDKNPRGGGARKANRRGPESGGGSEVDPRSFDRVSIEGWPSGGQNPRRCDRQGVAKGRRRELRLAGNGPSRRLPGRTSTRSGL